MSLARERDVILSSIGCGRLSGDETAFFEAQQDAAKVPGIQPERSGDFSRRWSLPMCQFVEDPDVRERKRALEVALLQDPNLLSVKAVKAAHTFSNIIDTGFGWH